MEVSPNEDDDIELANASAGLLSELEAALPKILWKAASSTSPERRVHTQAKQRDLDYVIKRLEPFQGEPQLLDTKLRTILPSISEAYIQYLQRPTSPPPHEHLDLQSAICNILYTFCKVRGYKIVLGFLNNEPRYLEPILAQIESLPLAAHDPTTAWQVTYILLRWLSHLTLTPFDLASISGGIENVENPDFLDFRVDLPPIARRIMIIALRYLPATTKAQDAAAILLLRLVERPDMQKFQLADAIASKAQTTLLTQPAAFPATIYSLLGPLRFLSGVASSSELKPLIPSIYATCVELAEDPHSPLPLNAVGKKVVVKIFRNATVQSLRSESSKSLLRDFLETANVLENVIDYLLRSLEDRDTPVRYAAAKALSLIILELAPGMGLEVIQAMLDSFKEDMPRTGDRQDFRAMNPLKWHGLTLALAHVLFKRSASPDQLPDIVHALVTALQFEQRTATGSSVGTNVRDAANFGIWSLSRRYRSEELLSVHISEVVELTSSRKSPSVIQYLADQLLLSACLDPAGNVRRGSSAALQELIGRHPDQVYEGISLVQVVDYQAVGLRRRAMVDVAARAGQLHSSYWNDLARALFAWRGLGSADVEFREAAAYSLASLSKQDPSSRVVLLQALDKLQRCLPSDFEALHGVTLSLALLFRDLVLQSEQHFLSDGRMKLLDRINLLPPLEILLASTTSFQSGSLRSDLRSAVAQLVAALCQYFVAAVDDHDSSINLLTGGIDTLAERVLARQEDSVLQKIPDMAKSLLRLKMKINAPLNCIEPHNLGAKISSDSSRSTTHGAGRAIALGTLLPVFGNGLTGENALAGVKTLGQLTSALNLEWRVIGIKALQLAIESCSEDIIVDTGIIKAITDAVHQAMNDYTIDERGDVGSLMRLQGIATASALFASSGFRHEIALLQVLQADIIRLSLEKLDRVRLAAAGCQHKHFNGLKSADVASVSDRKYFAQCLLHLAEGEPDWKQAASLEGLISCAGLSAEPLLQAARTAFVQQLNKTSTEHLLHLMSTFSSILKSRLLENENAHPALELLAFLFDMQIPQRLEHSTFKWRGLLSSVQKSHFKSIDIQKILSAVHVYRGLADIFSIRSEVLKKLISMLKSNPYPRVRLALAEQLLIVTVEPGLKSRNWMKPILQNADFMKEIERVLQGS